MKSRSHRLPTISDTPDDWVEESWTVDCVCGVNFDDGEEMVNCDECGVWVHTRCSRYVKSEKSFACDKCKSKNLRNESEETEVAQLLVELPTKTMRMENSSPMSYPPLQVWTEVPMEEKVHVQGIPGGDPVLFGSGLSSVFSPQLWKCTGYVPKKFNYQYREFSCWDDGDNGKEENGNPACTGADTLFSLSKENALPDKIATLDGMKSQVDMGPPPSDKKKEVENHESRREHNDEKRERSLLKPIMLPSGNRTKHDIKVLKDLKRTKAKTAEREGDSKRGRQSSESAYPTSSDTKQSESCEGRSPKVVKTDKQSSKHESPRADVHAIRKSEASKTVGTNNNPFSRLPTEKVVFDASRRNPSNKEKQVEENNVNQVPPGVEISPQIADGAAQSLIHNTLEIASTKKEVGHTVVHGVNDNGKGSGRNDGAQTHADKPEKAVHVVNDHQSFQDSNGELLASPIQPVEVKVVEIDNPGETSDSRNLPASHLKLDSSKSLAQDTALSPDPLSASVEVKDDAISGSLEQKVQNIDKSTQQGARQTEDPCQSKGHSRGSKSSMVSRNNSSDIKHGSGPAEGPSKSHGTVTTSGASSQCKTTVSAVGKSSSAGKQSSSSTVGISKASVPDKTKHSNSESRNSGIKQKGTCDDKHKNKNDNTSSETHRDGDAHERPKKLVKDIPKSLSTPALKSSHLSKFSHAPVSRKNSSDFKDLRDPTGVSSSKTSSAPKTAGTPDSGDSVNSLQGESVAHAQNKSTSDTSLKGEKTNQLNRPPTPKDFPPSVHPPAPTNAPATLSDEELALLLHQELNSSPRVPRVPRMRHAGSLPQLSSPTPTSTLMKRTFTYGGKDHSLVSRKKNKDFAKDAPSNNREHDGAKVERVTSLPNTRKHDLVDNGSAKVMHSVDKSALPASTTASSGPSSSTEANEHNMSSTHNSPRNVSEDDTGAIGGPAHRTLPALIAEIMSKGQRMTYEELCNSVLPHWPNLRKHNGERYAYSSHSQAVLDCLRNRSEWSRLVDRGPKTNGSRKRRKGESDPQNTESEERDYNTSTKDVEGKSLEEFPKGKRKARKRRRLALQGRGIKDVRRRRRRKAEVLSDEIASSSESSQESSASSGDEEVANEASGSSDETGAMS